jgi:hypothetical protein
VANKIQIRRGTAGSWTAANPTLLQGETGWESDTGFFKIGDGSTAWTSLGYWFSTLSLKETAYTPTFQGFGTPSAISFSYVRAGNKCKIIGKFTSGTVAVTEARISLPGALISDAALIPSIMVCGTLIQSQTFAPGYCLIESGVGYITFGVATTAAALTKLQGNGITNTGITIAIQAEIPISGWNGP